VAAFRFAPAEIARRLAQPSPAVAEALAQRAPVLAGAALLAAAWLAALRWARRPRASAVMAGVAVAELFLAHRHPNPVAPKALYTYRPEAVDRVRQAPLPRVYAYDYSAREAGRAVPPLASAPQGWSLAAAQALAQQLSLTPATAGRWDLDTGWDLDYRGLYPHWLAQLAIALRKAEGTPLLVRLLRMGAVTHVVALHQEGFEDLVPVAELPSWRAGPVRVFAVPGTLPRAYAVGGVRHAADLAAVEQILARDFDPAREVILDDPGSPATAAGPVGDCRIVERRPDRVRIEADLGAPGYVVLVDGFSAGWRATVDGRPAPLLRANLAFRAVAVPAGRHVIEMAYRPTAALMGLGLSALTAVACAFVLLRRR
jgi:Bacterial membrane protein YfhO